MTDNHNVQDENLIDDQVLQDLGASATVPAPTPAPQPEQQTESLIPAPTGIGVTPQNQQVDNTPATQVADQPTSNPLLDEADEPSEEPQEETKPAKKSKTHAPALGHGNGDDDELLNVKKKALEDLSPLVDKLELEPKERFQTLMEILQASDDRTLVKPALEAAEAIEDESERAQALLDVVNEVNYLTQEK